MTLTQSIEEVYPPECENGTAHCVLTGTHDACAVSITYAEFINALAQSNAASL